jgi:hypothetical protein
VIAVGLLAPVILRAGGVPPLLSYSFSLWAAGMTALFAPPDRQVWRLTGRHRLPRLGQQPKSTARADPKQIDFRLTFQE